MIKKVHKAQCCGCEACLQVCPRQCISMQEDREGFLYPSVDEQSCVDCALCESVCPALHPGTSSLPLEVLAVRNPDREVLRKSSSGGLFAALAGQVLGRGGVVFGAAFRPDFLSLHHTAVEAEEDLPALMGSKYLQSRMDGSFLAAKSFLEAGRPVLFCGTSCQIKALKLFLRKDYENLLAVDFICHGVPSPAVWRSYLGELLPEGQKPRSVSFRDKRTGWAKFSFTLTAGAEGREKEISSVNDSDPYMWLFLNDYTLRPSCYACPAKGGKSCSDLTLGDYWGIDTAHPEFEDRDGVGLLTVNSRKGKDFLAGVTLDTCPSSLALALQENPAYRLSRREPRGRGRFFRWFASGKLSIGEMARRLRREKGLADFFAYLGRKMHKIKRRLS